MADSALPIKRGRSALAMAVLVFGLPACELLQPHAPPPAPPSTAALPVPTPAPPPVPPHKPAPPTQQLANLPPSTAERDYQPQTPATAEAPAALESGTPDRLIGLDQPHIAQLLGEPRTRAESPPAMIWRYAGTECELDVYFYLDLQSQAMKAIYYEVRSHDPPDRNAQRCYADILGERRAHSESPAGTDRPR
jgi:hypothetical protein